MKNQAGYTILEALLALVVISFLSMPIYHLLITEHRLSIEGRDKAVAYFLAAGAMEKLQGEERSAAEWLNIDSLVEMNGKLINIIRKVRPRFSGGIDSLYEVEISVCFKGHKMAHLTHLFGGSERDSSR